MEQLPCQAAFGLHPPPQRGAVALTKPAEDNWLELGQADTIENVLFTAEVNREHESTTFLNVYSKWGLSLSREWFLLSGRLGIHEQTF